MTGRKCGPDKTYHPQQSSLAKVLNPVPCKRIAAAYTAITEAVSFNDIFTLIKLLL